MSVFDLVYARLRQVMIEAGEGRVVTVDEPGTLVLRTDAIDAKTGQPGWFGTVAIRKSYVAYHLMPLHGDPTLADGLSPTLARRRQGKTCFNFTKVDEALFAELLALTRRVNAGSPGAVAD